MAEKVRLGLIGAGFALVYPSRASNAIGIGLIVVVLVIQWLRRHPRAQGAGG